ncbi:ThuA domain-containing protein [Humibacter ginsenosidimutans]|uniref:Trehalose utilization protein ThuA n=1 Tax=Humibacter ginsenosidimutans TaxID=2599293 RepID=A0A5B8M7V3_9MICO|nr:ThuA domain-containing protein [Humibacter ginsenosidimutans]QDZ16094.1 trehalose utilization protein ThuA [Humibacter ginsenosidimutans]
MTALRVTVWNEYVQDATDPAIVAVYPRGIHAAISEGLSELLGDDIDVRHATMGEPEHGLSRETLSTTDVLFWWGHLAHDDVADAVVDAVQQRVLDGMGLIVLHSAAGSKIFRRLMGTSCRLDWRHGDRELLWTVNPTHPIAEGVPHPVIIPEQEMYGEFFDIPVPDQLVFISSFSGGEVFRSGCCFLRGKGRIFYFSPGHEEYPVYLQPEVKRILANAARWATPTWRSDIVIDDGAHRDTGWFENGER